MRLHQPTGIWLLLWPCWWAILMAGENISLALLFYFLIGSVVMRGAGCIINDLWDRDIDRRVERTRNRPLASGELSVKQGLYLLAMLFLIAFIILLQLNLMVWLLAIASLFFVAVYPVMKRITWWPQAFLGLTFNFGALMGWAAVTGTVTTSALLLYAAGFFWTLGYDTIYAHQDKRDDTKVGVKSTALCLGTRTKTAVLGFYFLSTVCLMTAGWVSSQNTHYFFGVALFGLHLLWQIARVNLDNPADCMQVFKSNSLAGALIVLGLLANLFF